MSAVTTVVRAGFARGGIELRQSLTSPADLWSYLFPSIGLLVAIFFMRDAHVPGTSFSLGASTLPGAFGMGLAFTGLISVAMLLVVDREDGTLLRAKATPNGMGGYLIGKFVLISGVALFGFIIQLVPGLFLVDGLTLSAAGAFSLLWLVPLGLVATMPIGAAIGSLIDSSRSMGLVILPVAGLVAISGVFYPITGLPGWLQGVAQFFPIYWLGLGVRSAFLPHAMAVVELGHSWRHLMTFAVLALWAAAGLVLAPILLRRMSRRESGSAVAARREKAIARAV